MRDRDRRVPGVHKPATPVKTASLRPVRDSGKPGQWAPLASTYTRAHMHPHEHMYTCTRAPTHTYTHAHMLVSLPELTEITFRTDVQPLQDKGRIPESEFYYYCCESRFPPPQKKTSLLRRTDKTWKEMYAPQSRYPGHGFFWAQVVQGLHIALPSPSPQPTLNTPEVLTTVITASQTWHTSTTPAAPRTSKGLSLGHLLSEIRMSHHSSLSRA